MAQTSLDDHLRRDVFYLIGCSYDGKVGKACLKLLNPENQEVRLLYDETGHKPYCYVKEPPERARELKRPGVVEVTSERESDLLRDREVEVTKIIASDPLAVGGGSSSIRERIKAWEADIPYHLCYLYDMELTPSMPYSLADGKLIEAAPRSERIRSILETHFKDSPEDERRIIADWPNLLEEGQHKYKHLSPDIEGIYPVATRVSRPWKVREDL